MNQLEVADRIWPVLHRLMNGHAWLYRASGGRVGRTIPGIKAPVLLLDHVGAKSGKERTTPLLYIPDPDSGDVAIIASKGGFVKNPAWYYNLRAHPDVEVQIGREPRPVRARELSGEERERVWKHAVELYPSYADYQARTERQIPVFLLERSS